MTLCSVNDVKTVLTIPTDDTSHDELITRLIGVADEFVARRTRRQLTPTTETRLYNGMDKGYVELDDFLAVGSVELIYPNGTVWRSFSVANGEVRPYPYNKTPHTQLILANQMTENPYRVIGKSPYIFPRGYGNVRVSGLFGSYWVVPEELRDLGVDLVASKFNKGKSRGLQSVSIGGQSMSFTSSDIDDGMKMVLENHRRQFVGIFSGGMRIR